MIGVAELPSRAWRPRALRVLLAAVVLTATAVALPLVLQRTPTLPGTQLDGRESPNFGLTDHRGVHVELSSLRGRPVVLSFLFANCPDVCLLTTAGLAETARSVPEAAFVGISVDPRGDDPSTVRRFLARQGLTDRLAYLTGPTPELERVWAAYFVHADAADHTDAIYLIDKHGRQRALLRSDFDPAELTVALKALL